MEQSDYYSPILRKKKNTYVLAPQIFNMKYFNM